MRHSGIKIFLLLLLLVLVLGAVFLIRDPSVLPFGKDRQFSLTLPFLRPTQAPVTPVQDRPSDTSASVQQPAVQIG